MTDFTPGPWAALSEPALGYHQYGIRWSVFDPKAARKLALCYGVTAADPTAEANARLIAAAPDMYAALDEVVGMGFDMPAAMTGVSDLQWAQRRAGNMQRIARAALAKVDGK